MSVEITNRQRRFRINRKEVENLAALVLAGEGVGEREVSLLLVNNDQIRELNRRYLKRNYPTDVLSFPQNEGPDCNINNRFLGDVVLSTEQILLQTPENGERVEDEFALCLIHGILHLLGYSDHPSDFREIMRLREEKFLKTWKETEHSPLIILRNKGEKIGSTENHRHYSPSS